jgi:hypothetical protein
MKGIPTLSRMSHREWFDAFLVSCSSTSNIVLSAGFYAVISPNPVLIASFLLLQATYNYMLRQSY